MAELLALVDGAAVAEVPLLAEDVHDVPGLVAVAAMLSGDARR
jgi:hypothetical protein